MVVSVKSQTGAVCQAHVDGCVCKALFAVMREANLVTVCEAQFGVTNSAYLVAKCKAHSVAVWGAHFGGHVCIMQIWW